MDKGKQTTPTEKGDELSPPKRVIVTVLFDSQEVGDIGVGMECAAGRTIEVGEVFESLDRGKGDTKIEN